MKISLIGPLPPYRGGISHSNQILYNNLKKRHKVTGISFKRQFPEILWKKKQKQGKEKTGEHILDSINPINWIKIANQIRKKESDIVIFQYWTIFFFPCYISLIILIRILTNSRISIICQNVIGHEPIPMEKFLAKKLFNSADLIITYSSNDKKSAEELTITKVKFIIEPTYNLGERIEKKIAKKKLGMKGKNILFFGFVREYKGLEYLIKSMKRLNNITLHIVGEFWEDKRKYLDIIIDNKIYKKITITDKYITDEQASIYFSACDAIILPYTQASESGIIQMAFHYNTPVITTNIGSGTDLIKNKKTGLIIKPKNQESIEKAIRIFYKENLEKQIKKNMKNSINIFKWTREKERILLGEP